MNISTFFTFIIAHAIARAHLVPERYLECAKYDTGKAFINASLSIWSNTMYGYFAWCARASAFHMRAHATALNWRFKFLEFLPI